MKTKLSIVVLVVFGMVLMGSSVAHCVSATADVTANLIAPITIENTQALSFGEIVADDANSGTVVVDTDGVRTANSVIATGGTVSQASFSLGGESDHSYSVYIPGSVTIKANSGENSMIVEHFTSDKTNTSIPDTLNIGATLNIKAAQATGNYTGTFSIDVNYD